MSDTAARFRPSGVDFTSFSHRRLFRDAHESDQNEISYFLASDPRDRSNLVVRAFERLYGEGKSAIEQIVARISFRLTYMVTPNISIQYWGQPFGSSGKYKNYKD